MKNYAIILLQEEKIIKLPETPSIGSIVTIKDKNYRVDQYGYDAFGDVVKLHCTEYQILDVG